MLPNWSRIWYKNLHFSFNFSFRKRFAKFLPIYKFLHGQVWNITSRDLFWQKSQFWALFAIVQMLLVFAFFPFCYFRFIFLKQTYLEMRHATRRLFFLLTLNKKSKISLKRNFVSIWKVFLEKSNKMDLKSD